MTCYFSSLNVEHCRPTNRFYRAVLHSLLYELVLGFTYVSLNLRRSSRKQNKPEVRTLLAERMVWSCLQMDRRHLRLTETRSVGAITSCRARIKASGSCMTRRLGCRRAASNIKIIPRMRMGPAPGNLVDAWRRTRCDSFPPVDSRKCVPMEV
jgi:hypothetical protein